MSIEIDKPSSAFQDAKFAMLDKVESVISMILEDRMIPFDFKNLSWTVHSNGDRTLYYKGSPILCLSQLKILVEESENGSKLKLVQSYRIL